MRMRKDSSRKRKRKSWLRPMANSSKIHNRSGLSIANFSFRIRSKEDSNSSRSKSTFRTSKRKESSFTTKKQWYLLIYLESSPEELRGRTEEKRTRKDQIEEVLERPEEAAQKEELKICKTENKST